MASFQNAATKNFMDNLLPSFGSPRAALPIWDEGQKMFILNSYESAAGHLYYEGMRIAENFVVKEKVGLYHTWTYLDSLELYAFDGTKLVLIQRRDFESTFRNETLVRELTKQMITDYIIGSLKIKGEQPDVQAISKKAEAMVEKSYNSFLNPEYNRQLIAALPQLKA